MHSSVLHLLVSHGVGCALEELQLFKHLRFSLDLAEVCWQILMLRNRAQERLVLIGSSLPCIFHFFKVLIYTLELDLD